jgi:hypothetical protein
MADGSVSTGLSFTYPGAGIVTSTGSAWGTSITDNSSNWNTAFGWGNHAGLYLPIGGGTLTGALSGTSASFSGQLTARATSTSAPSTGTGLYLGWGGSTNNYNGINFQGVSATDMYFGRAISSDDLVIRSASGEIIRFTASGAANFNSSVTARGGKSQFVADGGTGAGAEILLKTSLTSNPTLRRNWAIATEDQIEGDFVIKSSNEAGGSPITARLVILSNGNVGIGTNSPSCPLDVVANNSTAIHFRLRGRASDSIGQMEFWNNAQSTRYGYIATDSSSMAISSTQAIPLTLGTNTTERMRITSGGNVGIGTTSPGALLNVHGTASNKLTLSGGSSQNALTLSEISGFGNSFYLFNGDGGLGNGFGIYNITTATLPFHISNGGISIFSSGLSRMLLFNSTNSSGPYAGWQRNGSDEFYIGKSNAIGGGSGFYDLYTNSAGGGLRFFTNGAGSPALTITTGQSVGIGTTPSGNWGSRSVLQLGGFGTSLSGFNGGGGATNLSHNAIANAFNYTYLINGGATSQYMDGSDIVWANAPSGTAGNAITFSERMRIDTSGRLLVGTSSPISSASNTSIGATFGLTFNWLAVTDSNYIQRSNNSQGDYFSFYRGSTYTGSISVLGSTTYFNATSDYRLKEDLKNINGLETVNKIKVYDYKWKESDQRMDGVLAHELAEVLPYAVTGVKDGDKMQSVDYSKIVPVMVQAIKELKAELDTLKNK